MGSDIIKRMNVYYRTKKILHEGILFDSKLEVDCYKELRLLQAAKKIDNLKFHEKFYLKVEGTIVCSFETDFTYIDVVNQKSVCREAKGYWTPVARLKWKLFQALYAKDFDRFEVYPEHFKQRKKRMKSAL